jgi:NAD(P)-dependent dehydrogenase (short-subunit alcohol dehydrogenase family)
MELQGKAIVITGAAQGLGRKMAETIAAEGAKIASIWTRKSFRTPSGPARTPQPRFETMSST